ncbi:twin-arginine translocation signal domain-containing protein [bacterium]|nr:twin-arginine translocation signal domain-containing protein [bacterium]
MIAMIINTTTAIMIGLRDFLGGCGVIGVTVGALSIGLVTGPADITSVVLGAPGSSGGAIGASLLDKASVLVVSVDPA